MNDAFPNRITFECLAHWNGLDEHGRAAMLGFDSLAALVNLKFHHPLPFGDTSFVGRFFNL
jgi:hypothetical protein